MAKQRSIFKSLRGKITFEMLLVSLIPLVIVAVLLSVNMSNLEDDTSDSVDTSYSALEEDVIQATLSQDAYRLALEMENDMAARIDYVQTYASAPVCLAAALTGDLESPEAKAASVFLAEQLLVTPYFTVFSHIDENGKGISGGYFDPAEGLVADIHWAYKNFLGNDFTQSEWWEPFSQSDNGLYVSDTEWIPASMGIGVGMYLINIIVEIQDTNGVPLGAVVGTTVLVPADMSMNYAAKYPNTRIMVFNRSNEIVADSGDWLLSNEDINGDGQLNDVMPKETGEVAWSDVPEPVMRWLDNETQDRTLEDEFDFTQAEKQVRQLIAASNGEIIPARAFTTQDGAYVVGYARAATDSLEEDLRTEGYAGSGFTFMAEQPAEVAFAALESLDELESDLEDNTQSMLVTVLIILGVVLVVVLAVAFYLSRGITNPIVKLSDAAEKVSMGELDVDVTVKSNDELGDLAESFGRMVAAYRFMAQDED